MCVPIFLQKFSVGREFSLTNAKYYTTILEAIKLTSFMVFFNRILIFLLGEIYKKVLEISYQFIYHIVIDLNV